MKVIIAGSRTLDDVWSYIKLLEAVEKSQFKITEVISGTAKGIDTLAIQFAQHRDIPVTRFPAYWYKYGKSAGYKRNIDMANYADALIAVWEGKSKGTKHMIDIATKKGLKVFVYEV